MYNGNMKIIKLKEIDSTHRYIKDYILENGYMEPLCVLCDYQTEGIGSRETFWLSMVVWNFLLCWNSILNSLNICFQKIFFSNFKK